MASERTDTADVILAGGGLANCLIAWRLRQLRPELAVTIIEAGDRLGGNHTWSFHESDITPGQLGWLEPFIVHRWTGQRVIFPDRRRQLATGYRSLTAERLHEVMAGSGAALLTGRHIASVAPDGVTLEDGSVVSAPLVLDGRGYAPSPHLDLAWQKFLGQEVRLTAPHGLTTPVIMDATVPQLGGYRFVYVLPFSATELLIEDTYYADGAALDIAELRGRIADYAAAQDWQIEEVLREEDGVLPITLGGDLGAHFDAAGAVPVTGLRAALFPPVTGYSLPSAVRLADVIAAAPDMTSGAVSRLVRAHAVAAWQGQGFYRLLNRMLFWAARPEQRYKVLQRFYGLPEGLIQRFYAGTNTAGDKMRLLAGKPPVPIHRAVPCLAGRHPDSIFAAREGMT